MNSKELMHYADHHDNFEIRVISHTGSRCYRVELEDAEGRHHTLTRRGKPVLFRTLEDVHLELKRAGIHRAYLVKYVDHDAVVGRGADYPASLTSRMPLMF